MSAFRGIYSCKNCHVARVRCELTVSAETDSKVPAAAAEIGNNGTATDDTTRTVAAADHVRCQRCLSRGLQCEFGASDMLVKESVALLEKRASNRKDKPPLKRRAGACEMCKQRKIKCIRDDNNDASCEFCSKKGIQCSLVQKTVYGANVSSNPNDANANDANTK